MHNYCLSILTLLSLGYLAIADVDNETSVAITDTTTSNYETSPANYPADTASYETSTESYEITTEGYEITTEGYDITTEDNEITTESHETTDIANKTSTVEYETDTHLDINEKTQCVEILQDWCSRNKYPTTDNNWSILSVSYFDLIVYSRIFCSLAYDGIDCIKDSSQWFHCYPNGTLTYNNINLNDSIDVADDYICRAKDAALKIGPDMKFDQLLLDYEMKRIALDIQDFFRQFLILKDMFDNIKRQIAYNDPTIMYIGTEFDDIIGK